MSLARSFADLRSRLHRVDDQLRVIAEEVRVLDLEHRRIVGQFEADTSDYVFRVEGDPPPLSIGLCVGEAVHNLRATLDNLIYALVVANGGTPTAQTQFVIADTKESWNRQTTPKKASKPYGDRLFGLTVAQRALIESLQPCNAYGFPEENALFELAQLSNRDKHRILLPAFCFARYVSMESFLFAVPLNADAANCFTQSIVSGFASGDNAEVCRVKLVDPGPDPKMRMSKGYTLEVALSAVTSPMNLSHFIAIELAVVSIVDKFAISAGI